MKALRIGVAAAICFGQVAQAEFETPSEPPAINPTTPDGRNWVATARGYAGWADNVALVADGEPFPTEKSSAFVGGSLDGAATLYQNNGWTLGVAGRLHAINYLEDGGDAQIDEYSMYTAGAAAYAARDLMLADMPARATFSYDFLTEDAGDVDAIGLDAHRLIAGLAVEATETVTLDVAVSVADEDFEVEFANLALNDRDSTRTTASVGGSVLLSDKVRAAAHYRYTDNDANGTNFAYTGHQISGSVTAVLSYHVLGRIQASHETRDYNGFQSPFITPPGRTEQDVTVLIAQAQAHLTDHVDIDAYVRHEIYGSNSAAFEADDTRIGLGLSYRF